MFKTLATKFLLTK